MISCAKILLKSTKLSLKTAPKSVNSDTSTAKHGLGTKREAIRSSEIEGRNKDATWKKDGAKKCQTGNETRTKTKSAEPLKPIKLGSKDVPLNIGSDSSFEVESPVKVKITAEARAHSKDVDSGDKDVPSQPKFSLANLSLARSERIKRKEAPSNGDTTNIKKELVGKVIPTIRSKEVRPGHSDNYSLLTLNSGSFLSQQKKIKQNLFSGRLKHLKALFQKGTNRARITLLKNK